VTWAWAWRHLLRHRGQTVLAVLGVAVSAALLLDMLMLSGGLERSFEALLLSRGYQIRITPAGTLPFDTEATLADATTLLAEVRADPDVAAAGTVLGFAPFAAAGDGRTRLVGYGIEPGNQGIYRLVRGSDLGVGDTTGVLLAEPTAARLGLTVGDSLHLVAGLDPQTAVATTNGTFAVRGIVAFLYDAREQASIALDLAPARRLAGARFADRASVVLVRARDGIDPTLVAERLAASRPTVQVASVADLLRQFQERLTYFRQLSLVLASIALVVTVLLIGTLLAITVNERLVEIATLRAIGVSRRTIVLQVLAHGALLSLLGTLLGGALGVLAARRLDAILTAFPGLPASVSFFVAAPRPLLLGAALLLVTGILSGGPPAWRAANAPAALTLREDGA
jgi:putative ABC transport system permease protein